MQVHACLIMHAPDIVPAGLMVSTAYSVLPESVRDLLSTSLILLCHILLLGSALPSHKALSGVEMLGLHKCVLMTGTCSKTQP